MMRPTRNNAPCGSDFLILVFVLFFITAASVFVTAQTEDVASIKAKALELMRVQKMTEALPLLEKLAQLTPNDAEVQTKLGFALMGQAANTFEEAERRQFRVRARNAFIKAHDLGDDSQLIKGLIEGLPPDGSTTKGFSDNAEANKLMEKGEAAFSSGKMDDALAAYQNALKIDPKCYFAALFAGDVYKEKGSNSDAETWYQKAIAIDPNVETAYRYSATPLMKEGKYDQARDRYVEAFIVEPYSRLALNGIIQWGQVTKTSLRHPKVDVPEITIGADGKANTTININPLADDGSMAWMSYETARETWKKEKFAKAYPKETEYRHSLMEEADALRSVVSMAKTLKPKNLNEQIAIVAKLDQDGLLEAFILMAIPDQGIVRDHAAYLRSNRDKLRQYVNKYVIGGGR